MALPEAIYPSRNLLLPPVDLPTELDQFIIDSEQPLTPTEQRLLREGRYPPATAKLIVDADRRTTQAFSSTSALSMTSSISTTIAGMSKP